MPKSRHNLGNPGNVGFDGSEMIYHRDLSKVLRAFVRPQHYRAALEMLRIYHRPVDAYARYLFGYGVYPAQIHIKTPIGDIGLTIYSHHDMITVNEVFCRQDYASTSKDQVFVDIGSNIGISAAYFLTRSHSGFAYLYEPVPSNVARLRRNLAFLEGRFAIEEVAVGIESGMVRFGIEETGRYGGIGDWREEQIEVRCVDSNDVLRAITAKHGRIDVLKVDIEGLESEVVARIPRPLWAKISTIYAECRLSDNPMAETHSYRENGSIARFALRGGPATVTRAR
jgi:FkbM family methyltransferase